MVVDCTNPGGKCDSTIETWIERAEFGLNVLVEKNVETFVPTNNLVLEFSVSKYITTSIELLNGSALAGIEKNSMWLPYLYQLGTPLNCLGNSTV
jgi:hypothetical protein